MLGGLTLWSAAVCLVRGPVETRLRLVIWAADLALLLLLPAFGGSRPLTWLGLALTVPLVALPLQWMLRPPFGLAWLLGLVPLVAVALVIGGPQPAPRAGEVSIRLEEIGNRESGGFSVPQAFATGDSVALTASAGMFDSQRDASRFHWSSSDPGVAAVDEKGVVWTRAPGTARITARFDSVAGRPFEVRVVPGAAVRLAVTASHTQAAPSESLRFQIEALDSGGASVPGVPISLGALELGRSVPCLGEEKDCTPCVATVAMPDTETLELRARTLTILHRSDLVASAIVKRRR